MCLDSLSDVSIWLLHGDGFWRFTIFKRKYHSVVHTVSTGGNGLRLFFNKALRMDGILPSEISANYAIELPKKLYKKIKFESLEEQWGQMINSFLKHAYLSGQGTKGSVLIKVTSSFRLRWRIVMDRRK